MAGQQEMPEAQAQAVAEAMGLDLPPEQLRLLAKALPDFLSRFQEVRAIDKGDREPSTITWDRDA